MEIIAKYGGEQIELDEPEICPLCKHALKPETLGSKVYADNQRNKYYSVLYLCNHCYQPFIGHYRLSDNHRTNFPWHSTRVFVEPNRFVKTTFNAHINDVSPSFVEIYNQALAAESDSLDQIAGIGYRKALEFLIKDYLIHKSPEDEQAIKDAPLGACINKRVSDPRIKAVAERSAWLGNDQTHYIKKFDDYDLEALKRFINTTVYWISMELNTEEALEIEPRR